MTDKTYAKNQWEKNVLQGETIMMFPLFYGQYAFFGIGKVLKIDKGKEYDIINITFKPTITGERIRVRQVVVIDNHARRQELTVKRGQYAYVFGRAYKTKVEYKNDDGSTYPVKVWQLAAHMLQGVYVPTAFDVKKIEKERDEEEVADLYRDMSENESNFFDGLINEMFDKKGDKDEE